jgi:hypothetical protein
VSEAEITAALALAGDTMLGCGVATLFDDPAAPLVGPEVAAHMAGADAAVLTSSVVSRSRHAVFRPAQAVLFCAPPVAGERGDGRRRAEPRE